MTSVLVAAVAMVGLATPANASWGLLCTGYAGCNANGGDAGYGAASGTSVWGMVKGHNCTNYAAYRLQKNGVNASYLQGHGNAWQWGGVARAHGVQVDLSPRVGDIAWWDANSKAAPGSGHVAYVSEVGAGYFIASEDNFPAAVNNYSGQFRYVKRTAEDYPTGFIHFGGNPPPDRTTHSDIVATEANGDGSWRYMFGVSRGDGGFNWGYSNLTKMGQPGQVAMGDINGA